MVTLEGQIKRFVGLSSDVKPRSTTENPIPAGSSFLASDTGAIARFDGQQWRTAEPEYVQHELLLAIFLELRQLRLVTQIAHDVDIDEDVTVPV